MSAISGAGVRFHGHVYIDGTWATPDGTAFDDVINPATELIIGRVPVGTASDVGRAVAAARAAADSGPWPRLSGRSRSGLLRRLHEVLAGRVAEITDLAVAESGLVRPLARHLMGETSLAHLEFFADMAAREWDSMMPARTVPRGPAGSMLTTGVKRREPVGVVAAITPYNAPFLTNLGKAAAAIAMGNTVVLKPSPFTPLQALLLAQAFHEAGFPAGVFNVVTGGDEAGRALVSDPRVDLITFTGSDAVGSAIMQSAAPNLARVLLELGGKSAMIVRHDADLQAAVDNGIRSVSTLTGQGCALNTRHLVDARVADEYVAALGAAVQAMTVGDPSEDGVQIGPLIRASQRAKVEAYVEIGLDEGAEVVCGGRRPGHLPKGYFYEPTVFSGVDNSSRLAQEEIFGPVVAVSTFGTDEEAVALANDSSFGLHGSVFSRDSGTAFDMACRIRSGQIAINRGVGHMSPHAPFGGVKRSGLGREYGEEGLLEYTDIKTILFNAG